MSLAAFSAMLPREAAGVTSSNIPDSSISVDPTVWAAWRKMPQIEQNVCKWGNSYTWRVVNQHTLVTHTQFHRLRITHTDTRTHTHIRTHTHTHSPFCSGSDDARDVESGTSLATSRRHTLRCSSYVRAKVRMGKNGAVARIANDNYSCNQISATKERRVLGRVLLPWHGSTHRPSSFG